MQRHLILSKGGDGHSDAYECLCGRIAVQAHTDQWTEAACSVQMSLDGETWADVADGAFAKDGVKVLHTVPHSFVRLSFSETWHGTAMLLLGDR